MFISQPQQQLIMLSLLSLSLLFPILILLLFHFFFFNTQNRKLKRMNLPPGPRKVPILGNLHQITPSLDKSIPCLTKKHGPVLFLQLGSVPTVFISSVAAARDIFKNQDLIFSGRPELHVTKTVTYGCKSISFAPYGEYWREMRKIAILELLSWKKIRSFRFLRDQEIDSMMGFVSRSCVHSQPVNLNALSLLLANNVTARTVFGKKLQEDESSESRFESVLHEVAKLEAEFCVLDYIPWLAWLNKFNGFNSRLEKIFQELDEVYDEVIREHADPERLNQEHEEDLVDVLLRVQKDPSQTISLTNQDIKGILSDMLIAGTDTSATVIVWAMAELKRHPWEMEKAQTEIREIAKEKKKIEEEDLSKLTHLKMIIRETLRLHPPVPFLLPRETLEDSTIQNYAIPAKTRVYVDAKALGREPGIWEWPDEFLPGRFLGSQVDFRGQNLELIPFGAGRRVCPGMNSAVLLVELVLANLLCWFDWELPQGTSRESLDMEEEFGLVTFKKTPLYLVATPFQPKN